MSVASRQPAVTCRGLALHSGRPVTMTILPVDRRTLAKPYGVTFLRRDQKGARVRAVLGNVQSGALRGTALGRSDAIVATPEHLLAALSAHGVWDVEIHLDGDEVPILDGSGRALLEMVKSLPRQPEPATTRLPEPVLYCRDERTATMALPVEGGKRYGERIAVVNLPRLPRLAVGCFAYRHVHTGEIAFAAEIAPHPTFIELPPESLHTAGHFRGARLSENVLPAYDPDLWRSVPGLQPDALARHKILDITGDWFLLELTLRARVLATIVAIGTGHRDTHELTRRVWRLLEYGERPEADFGAARGVLIRNYNEGWIDAELFRHILDLLRSPARQARAA